ncbi:FMN-binding protein [Motilibacter peucedani]|uniref:FMN-binding protein n=1 Tax=Motilibacter peucedani TaxID=598650 RepID=UPI001E33E756|nr:FMN-binding protein [Motilibacter peucedani]
MQVQVTVKDGAVTDVQAVVYPTENGRDQEINSYALPLLHDEVIAAQSAQIDAVGGATVTSDGYISSLQSALDAAHLGS